MRPGRRTRVPWSQVASISNDLLVVTVVLAGGRLLRFDFSDADNGAQVVEAFTRAALPAAREEPAGDAGQAGG